MLAIEHINFFAAQLEQQFYFGGRMVWPSGTTYKYCEAFRSQSIVQSFVLQQYTETSE
jgi:hypothetical protein